MNSEAAARARERVILPKSVTSNAGYIFDPSQLRWKLDKDVSFSTRYLGQLKAEAELGFRLTLIRYAEDMSARHTANMANTFYRFLRDTGTTEVTAASLINWRGQLGESDQWRMGALKGFLTGWQEWGFSGISDEVGSLLEGWRIKGNEKGRAVAQSDPRTGPYTDVEIAAILSWANRAVASFEIELEAYACLLTLIMTARRPVQIAALRGADLVSEETADGLTYLIQFPRAKQRGSKFRRGFRSLPVIEDLYLVLLAQFQDSVSRVEKTLGFEIPSNLKREVPLFINQAVLDEVSDLAELQKILKGDSPDRLHAPTHRLKSCLQLCEAACTAKSERTGERIRLFATRFRYTRGTNLRREGFGAAIIAELLDHSDVQNVKVYTENTVREAEIINSLVGPKLAPFAQACMGTLVNAEREAVRGDDPRSRVPNHQQDAVGTCGNYGFCASGYRACYTCHHFQPWVNGPHSDVLEELYAEKQRSIDAGCAREVVSADDQLILAVEHCVALCEQAKGSQESYRQPVEHASVIGNG